MGLSFTGSISVITVFLEGLFSFFSPCVLPLLPIYAGYLSGGAALEGPEGQEHYDRKKVLINTLFFVLGIAFSFFLMGLGLRTLGRFFTGNRTMIARVGGVIVILFGLYQTGIFGRFAFMSKERRLPLPMEKMVMSPVTALLMGFVFSFAWTPCVGPVLSSVLLMATSVDSTGAGFLLIAVYTIGFAIPFLLTGLFTTSLLSAFARHRNVVKYTEKIGGILLIIMGILMLTGSMNGISNYFSRLSEQVTSYESDDNAGNPSENGDSSEAGNAGEEGQAGKEALESNTAKEGYDAEGNKLNPAVDFTLKDQYGKEHTLSEYKGKIVFLNIWATWCTYCVREMPDIQELYEEIQADPESDVVILGLAFPDYNGEVGEEEISTFLQNKGFTYPTLMNPGGDLLNTYYVEGYPTTYMIDKDGYVYGYVAGALSKENMKDIIEQTRNHGAR